MDITLIGVAEDHGDEFKFNNISDGDFSVDHDQLPDSFDISQLGFTPSDDEIFLMKEEFNYVGIFESYFAQEVWNFSEITMFQLQQFNGTITNIIENHSGGVHTITQYGETIGPNIFLEFEFSSAVNENTREETWIINYKLGDGMAPPAPAGSVVTVIPGTEGYPATIYSIHPDGYATQISQVVLPPRSSGPGDPYIYNPMSIEDHA